MDDSAEAVAGAEGGDGGRARVLGGLGVEEAGLDALRGDLLESVGQVMLLHESGPEQVAGGQSVSGWLVVAPAGAIDGVKICATYSLGSSSNRNLKLKAWMSACVRL